MIIKEGVKTLQKRDTFSEPLLQHQLLNSEHPFYFCPKSLLQMRVYCQPNGHLQGTSDFFLPVIDELNKRNIDLTLLIPESFWPINDKFDYQKWNAKTDLWANQVEEMCDTIYQCVKMVCCDSVTVDQLLVARSEGNVSLQRTVIDSRLNSPAASWVISLLKDDNLQLDMLTNLFINAMDSRSLRGVVEIQTVGDLMYKLTKREYEPRNRKTKGKGKAGNGSSEERVGEYAELLYAVQQMEEMGLSGLDIGEVYSYGQLLDEIVADELADEYVFFDSVLVKLVNRIEELLQNFQIPLASALQFAIAKQTLRMGIGNKMLELRQDWSIDDLRTIPKTLTKACLPALLNAHFPQVFEG